jgi:hypothetical protein
VRPIRRVMDSPRLSAAGIRFSILPSPAGDLGLDLAVGLLPRAHPGRPHRGLHVPHEEEMYTCGRSGCLLYAEVFGVLKPEPITNSGASATTHHRLNQCISMTSSSFDASQEIHSRSPVRPSPDPGSPPGSGVPLDFSGGFAQVVTDSARAGWRRDRTPSRVLSSNHFLHATSCRTDRSKCIASGEPGSRALARAGARDPAHASWRPLRAVVLGAWPHLPGVTSG